MMRCYNGCPDSELQAYLDRKAAARKRLKDAFPDASCTYFPVEQRFLVFHRNHQIGEFQADEVACIDSAIQLLSAL